MENQINVGDQDTQQIGKNSGQPVQALEKPKTNFWMISSVVLGILCILLALLYVQAIKTQIRENPPVSDVEIPKPTPTTEDQKASPLKNTLYVGLYDGKEVVFYTNDLADEGGSGAGGVKIEGGPYTGAMAAIGDKPLGYSNPYDYRQLVNPRKIADGFPSLIGLVVDAKYGANKNILYTSLLLDSRQDANQQYVSSKNVVYKINLGNMDKSEIWTTNLKKGVYTVGDTDFAGAAHIEQVIEDKYLILSVGLCFDCSPYSEKKGILILNIYTGKEKFLGMAGDMAVNSASNTVSYKKLEATVEPCPTETAYCNDSIGNGQRNVYRPAGSAITETLP